MTEYKCVRQSDEFKVSEDDVDLKTKLSSYVDGASPPVITEDNPVPSTWEEGDVRPLDHQNDCFYATLAGLQEKSIPEIELQTGISAKPTANLDEIKELYDKAGYYGEFKHFSDRTEVKNYIRDSLLARPNMGLKLAIGYILSGAECGHVKVIKAWISNKGELKYRLIDFQKILNMDQDSINRHYLTLIIFGCGKLENDTPFPNVIKPFGEVLAY